MGESFSFLAGGGKYKFRNFKDALDNKAAFREMGLTKREVKALFYKFRKADKLNNKRLDKDCFFDFISAEKELHTFSTRIFGVFDENSDGLVDFFEFVIGCWNYCTSSNQNLTFFAFDIYDRKTKGFITPEDLTDMMIEFYGAKYKDNKHAMEALQKIHIICPSYRDCPGLTIEEFQTFARTHQNMLYPVFALQRCLQIQTLGVSKWECIAKRTETIRREANFALKKKLNTVKVEIKSEEINQTEVLSGTLHARQTSRYPAEKSLIKQPAEDGTFITSTKNEINLGSSKPRVFIEGLENTAKREPRAGQRTFSSLGEMPDDVDEIQDDEILPNKQLPNPSLQHYNRINPSKNLRLQPNRRPSDSSESPIVLPLNLIVRPNLPLSSQNVLSASGRVAQHQRNLSQKPSYQTISQKIPRTQLVLPSEEALDSLNQRWRELKSHPNTPNKN